MPSNRGLSEIIGNNEKDSCPNMDAQSSFKELLRTFREGVENEGGIGFTICIEDHKMLILFASYLISERGSCLDVQNTLETGSRAELMPYHDL